MDFDVRYRKHVAIIGKEVSRRPVRRRKPDQQGDQHRAVPVPRSRRHRGTGRDHDGRTGFRPPGVRAHHDLRQGLRRPAVQRRRHRREVADDGVARQTSNTRSSARCARSASCGPAEPDNFSINKLDSLLGAFNNVVGDGPSGIGLLVTSIVIVRRRHRCHEYHVRVGDRAHAGDRHPQGDRRPAPQHPAAIPVRVRDNLPAGRPDRDRHRRRADCRDQLERPDAGEPLAPESWWWRSPSTTSGRRVRRPGSRLERCGDSTRSRHCGTR